MNSVLITGASRGIGLDLVKKLANHSTPPKIIIAACRNPQKAEELKSFSKNHKQIQIIQLDTTKFDTFDKVVNDVDNIVGSAGLNVLINNAGIMLPAPTLDDVTVEILTAHYMTNTVGPIMLAKAFLPLLKKAAKQNSALPIGIGRAAVINVSSLLGSNTMNTTSDFHGYRESKAALNIATRSLSAEVKKDGILVIVLHPGWVQTELGGANAYLTVDTSVSGIVKVLHSLSEKNQGGFIQWDGKEVPW